MGKFLSSLEEKGIKRTDPRVERTIEKLRELQFKLKKKGNIDNLSLEKEICRELFEDNLILFSRAFRDDFVIPDFPEFCKYIEEIYWKCKSNTGGEVADYIPQLAKFSPG